MKNFTAKLPFSKKSESAQYYFALNIGLSEVTSAVWEIYGNRLDIVGQAALPYQSSEELSEIASQALDQALGTIEAEPQKILFGVSDSWSIDEELKDPYLKLLRNLVKDFDLEPMAYVNTTNAISYLLQKKEGVPPTVILLGLGDYIEATLLKAGRVVEARSAKRTSQLFDDVEKVLRQFTEVEVLPSTILLYPTKTNENLAKIKSDLMAFRWMPNLPFLHFPKIDLLEENIMIKAIILAAATELNPQIDLKRSFTSQPTAPVVTKSSLISAEPAVEDVKPPAENEAGESGGNEESENLGFVQGDIQRTAHSGPPKNQTQDAELDRGDSYESASPHSFLTQDTEDLEDDNLVSPDVPDLEDEFEEVVFGPGAKEPLPQAAMVPAVPSKSEPVAVVHPVKKATKNHPLSKITATLSSVTVPLAGLAGIRSVFGKGVVGVSAIVLLLIGLVVGAYVYLLKSTLTIYVEPRMLENQEVIFADPKVTTASEEKKVIPATTIEATVTTTGKTAATDQKEIGDPAKGKVVIYNLTNTKTSFAQGTVLTSPSGLKFTLDTTVQIASQSSSLGADFTTVIKPGKSEAAGITASAIGPEGNLPADTELSVAGNPKSQFVARVEEALSGGTSKKVTVVAAKDQNTLKAKLLDELKKLAEEDLQKQLTGDKKIDAESFREVEGGGKFVFSKQVGDQASELSLTATVRYQGTAFSDADLKTLMSKLVKVNVPEGYTLDPESAVVSSGVSKVEKDGKLSIKVVFQAKLLPKLDTESLKQKIKGQSVEAAVNSLKEIDNVSAVDVEFTPFVPLALARIPFLEQNINIVVSPK